MLRLAVEMWECEWDDLNSELNEGCGKRVAPDADRAKRLAAPLPLLNRVNFTSRLTLLRPGDLDICRMIGIHQLDYWRHAAISKRTGL